MINWHRLFGIFLTDYFIDTPYCVELEKDLSIKQQLLDVVILKKESGDYQGILPDGLDNLTTHNLLSYKSMRESFDNWAILELIGHYVNYRKQITEQLLPEREFNLYAVSTRFPSGLAKQVQLIKLKPGVYEIKGFCYIRLIVLSQIAKAEHNAIWHLFSSRLDKVKYGAKQYHPKFNLSSSVNLLYDYYDTEGLMMAYTIEQFQKDVANQYLHYLSIDDILKQIPIGELLKRLPINEILKGLSANERLKDLPVNERLAGLSKEDLMRYLQQLEQKDTK